MTGRKTEFYEEVLLKTNQLIIDKIINREENEELLRFIAATKIQYDIETAAVLDKNWEEFAVSSRLSSSYISILAV